jgi:hypothetical protein
MLVKLKARIALLSVATCVGCGATPALQAEPVRASCENDLDGDGLPDVVFEESAPQFLRVLVGLSSESFATFHEHALPLRTRLYRAPPSPFGFRLFAFADDDFEVLTFAGGVVQAQHANAELPLPRSPLGLSIWPSASAARVGGHLDYWRMEGGQLLTWSVDGADTETPLLIASPGFTSIELPVGEQARQVLVFASNDSVQRYVVTLGPEEHMRLYALVARGDVLVAVGRAFDFGQRGRRPSLGQFGNGYVATRDGTAPGFFYSVAMPHNVGAIAVTANGFIEAFRTEVPYGGMAIASDFDGNGVEDLMVLPSPGPTMTGRRIDPSGESEFAVEGFPFVYGGVFMDLHALGDVDGDGRTDIAALWVDENALETEYWGILVHTEHGMRLLHQAALPERTDPLQNWRFL